MAAVVTLGTLTTSVSHAALFEVNNTDDDAGDNDPGDGNCRVPLTVSVTRRCTLRAAIEEANALSGLDTITLPAGSVRVGRSLPEVSQSLTITGRGSGSSSIAAAVGTAESGFQLLSTRRDTSLTLRVTGVSIIGQTSVSGSGANTMTSPANSGILCHVDATCFLTSSVVRQFRFEAVRAIRSNLTITNSTITANGTGVLNDFGATTTIDSSSISSNTSGVQGPAFQGAGGIVNVGGATVNVNNSTIASNTNGHPNNTGAGAISNLGTLNLTNATVAGNASGPAGGAGALLLGSGSTVMRHVTIAGNAGQPAIVATGGSVQMLSSIVAGNSPANCGAALPLAQADKNIDSGSSCGFNPRRTSTVSIRFWVRWRTTAAPPRHGCRQRVARRSTARRASCWPISAAPRGRSTATAWGRICATWARLSGSLRSISTFPRWAFPA
jgi:hypothetical protein